MGLAAAPAASVLAQTSTAAEAAASKTDAAEEPAPLSGHVVEDIVARVNDQVITNSDYQRALDQLDADAQRQGLPRQELEERKANLLRDLIDQQLLLSKGKQLGITGDTELVKRLDEIRKQNHLDSMEALEKAAQQQGVSYEDFKASIRNSIITQSVVRDEVGRHIPMTQNEVLAYFKEHESEFAQPESVRLSEILIPTGPAGSPAATSPNDEEIAKAQARAESVEEQLKAGVSFADLAKKDSIGSTAAQGGDLGEFRRGMLAKELEEKTFSLQAGQYTAPIRTKQGFIILEVTQHTPGGEASFKQVEPQVEQALFMERMQPALRQYLTKLREEAYVDIKPGYTDSGASQNELRPTYSAYTPPGPKKKKKFTRMRFREKPRKNEVKTASAAAPPPTAAEETANVNAAAAATGTKASAAQAQVAEKKPRVQKPGKKEKIRFGQAPREALPPATRQEPQVEAAENHQTAPGVGANESSSSEISLTGEEQAAPEREKKTRFADRAKVKKPKHHKPAADKATPPPATPEELATQKIQDAPLGLDDTAGKKKKKEKKKGPKTRYANTPQPPPPPQQQPNAPRP